MRLHATPATEQVLENILELVQVAVAAESEQL
jgi:hypothetical protein